MVNEKKKVKCNIFEECDVMPPTSILSEKIKEIDKAKGFGFKTTPGINIIRLFMKTYKMDEFLKKDIKDPSLAFPKINTIPNSTNLESELETNTLLDTEINPDIDTISSYYHAYEEKTTTPNVVINNIISLTSSTKFVESGIVAHLSTVSMQLEAEASTLRYQEGSQLSIIDGVPFFVNESYKLKGFESRIGTFEFSFLCHSTSESVKKLTEKGAICCGYSKMTYLGLNIFGINFRNKNIKGVKNSYNSKYLLSGGDPGSPTIVALGLCPFVLSIDKFGSVRISSGSSGTVGFRPPYGRISHNGLFSLYTNSFEQIGPITNSTRDAAIVYAFLAERSLAKSQNYIPKLILPKFDRTDFEGISFGSFPGYICYAEKQFVKSYLDILDLISENKGNVKITRIPELRKCMCAAILGEAKENFLYTYWQLGKGISNIEDICSDFILSLGKTITDNDAVIIGRQRSRAVNALKNLFKEVDILIFLTSCTIPLQDINYDNTYEYIDDRYLMGTLMYYFLPSLTGVPSITIPIGLDIETTLPISIQLVGQWYNEDILFEIAHMLENLIRFKGIKKLYRPLKAASPQEYGKKREIFNHKF